MAFITQSENTYGATQEESLLDTARGFIKTAAQTALERRGYIPSTQPQYAPAPEPSQTRVFGLSPLMLIGGVLALVGVVYALKVKKLLPF